MSNGKDDIGLIHTDTTFGCFHNLDSLYFALGKKCKKEKRLFVFQKYMHTHGNINHRS